MDYLLHAYLGLGSTTVQPGLREERKSVGVERTFDPISDQDQLIAKLEEIAQTLEEDLEHGGWSGKTITLKYKLATFQSYTRAKSCTRYIRKKADLFTVRIDAYALVCGSRKPAQIGKELLLAEMPLRIRLLGLRVTNLKDLKLSESVGIKRVCIARLSLPVLAHSRTVLQVGARLSTQEAQAVRSRRRRARIDGPAERVRRYRDLVLRQSRR